MGQQNQVSFVGGVLAAGRASRLRGHLKPFLWWQGGYLLEHAIRVLQDAGALHVILVMRPEHHRMVADVRSIRHAQRTGLVSVVNPTGEGLSHSVQTLYQAFEKFVLLTRPRHLGPDDVSSLILHQVDRPHVRPTHIRKLAELRCTSAGYQEDAHMVPPLKLPCGLAKIVSELKADQGMGALLRQDRWRPQILLHPEPAVEGASCAPFFSDVDTAADAIRLLQSPAQKKTLEH